MHRYPRTAFSIVATSFLHRHHRLERAFSFVSARTHRINQDLGGDLPRDASFIFAPAAFAFLPAIADDRNPKIVGFGLVLG
jgi:hypothetical protein